MRIFCALALMALAGPAMSSGIHGTSCKASAAAFSRLQNNMTYEQVREVIGCDGSIQSDMEMAGYRTVMLAWDGEGTLGANMNVMIQNGRMVMKSQFGLR